ncbi:MAG: hypothetical protein IIB95_11310 [Candidatus Marinimicrobia bacterium]|nr:hypothetical protein [Candidatus Neomarinimicrobiota bacterium]
MKILFKIIILVVVLHVSVFASFSFEEFSLGLIGPTIHYNFGGEKKHWSFGLELSYWEFPEKGWPVSVDLGIEFERGKLRIYTEFQTLVPIPSTGVFTGVSVGPVIEKAQNNGLTIGFQFSGWLALFGGIDLRYRRIGHNGILSPGIFLKGPIPYSIMRKINRYPPLRF